MPRCPPGCSVEQDYPLSFYRADRNLPGIPEHINIFRPSLLFSVVFVLAISPDATDR